MSSRPIESEQTKSAADTEVEGDPFPTAKVRQRRSVGSWLSQSTLLVWLVAAACLVAAIFISVRALSPQGIPITVHFENGYGLKAEDQVRYRGIVVGQVAAIELDEALQGVNVHIYLQDEAAALARQGSQFWVERPKISLGAIRGLETIVGGRYVAVLPGVAGGAVSSEFIGTEEPPPNLDVTSGGLDVLLIAENRFGLERGAPITYRGLRVGQVGSVALGRNTHSIEVRALIERRYRHLVRTNSRFWNNGGMDFKIGLRGVDVDVDTLSSLAAGGIGFATPDPAGPPAESGHTFELSDEEVDGWQNWRPLLERGRDATSGPREKPGFLDRVRARFSGPSPNGEDEPNAATEP